MRDVCASVASGDGVFVVFDIVDDEVLRCTVRVVDKVPLALNRLLANIEGFAAAFVYFADTEYMPP